MCGAMPLLLHASSWYDAYLIKSMDNFFILYALQGELLNAGSESIISLFRNRFIIGKTAQFVP
jgi:hypothetical protein